MVPTHFVRLLAFPRMSSAHIRVVDEARAHTGAKCPVDVKRAMIEWWGPVFTDAYGATEVGTTCQISSQEWLEHPGRWAGASRPSRPGVRRRRQRARPGQEGRLYFEDATGRGIVYPNDPEKTKAAHIAPGVFTLARSATSMPTATCT